MLMPTGGGNVDVLPDPGDRAQGCGVVVSPLIALMRDQVDTLKALGVKAEMLNWH